MLRKMVGMTSVIRVVVNLKVILGLMAQTEVTNILVEGITDDERRVLLEVSGSSLTKEAKETAHALFGLDSRMAAVMALRPVFRKARSARRHVLTDDEIKEIMED